MKIKIISLIFLCVISLNSYANNDFTGNTLIEIKELDNLAYISYLGGIFSILSSFKFTDNRFNVCPPNNVDFHQKERVIAKYLSDHPDKTHLNGTLLVLVALSESFPCK